VDRSSKLPSKTRSGTWGASPQARTGADGLLDDLQSTRRDLLSSRHPTYHRLLQVVASILSEADVADAEFALFSRFERAWRTRPFPTSYERPLLILAALRSDALQEGAGHPLYAALATDTPDPDAVTRDAVVASLGRDRLGVWSTLMTRRMQTNDTSCAIAWLWPAFLGGCDEEQRPLALVDMGASAGLNLLGDRLPPLWSDGTGAPIPCATRVNALARAGFDSRPLDAHNDDDVLWMRACLWPGDTERLTRFDAGVKAMRALPRMSAPVVERMTASLVPDHLDALVAPMPPSTLLLVYQTMLAGYLELGELENYRVAMNALLTRRAEGSCVWVELEFDDPRRKLPVALTAHVRAGDAVKSLRLARTNHHPDTIEPDPVAVAELRRRLTVE
jgi:hypothetical protein